VFPKTAGKLARPGNARPAAVNPANEFLGKIDALVKGSFARGRTFSEQHGQAAAKKHSGDNGDHFFATFIHEGDANIFAFYSP